MPTVFSLPCERQALRPKKNVGETQGRGRGQVGTAHTGIYNRLSGGSEHLRSQEFRSWRLDLPCEMSFALFSFHPSFTSWHAFLIIILRVENRCVKINRARSNLLHYLNIVAFLFLTSVQFSSVAQLCPTLCDPMNCSTPGLPVNHHLPEFTQTHFHQVNDAIQPSHPLSSSSPPAPNPSQHQSLFQ